MLKTIVAKNTGGGLKRLYACTRLRQARGDFREPSLARSLARTRAATMAEAGNVLVVKRVRRGAQDALGGLDSADPAVPSELACGDGRLPVLDVETARGEQLPSFDLKAFEGHLLSQGSGEAEGGWTVLAGRQVASTQRVLEENAKSLPRNTVVVADTQTQGKGRAGNAWVSPEGCLMCSVYCHVAMEGRKLPLLQYATTLAVVESLEALRGPAPAEGRANFASIKWPNDIYVRGTKVGGVLCQTVYRGSGAFQLIAGIGVNVDNDEPTFCVNQVLRELGEREIAREELLALMLPRLLRFYRIIAEESFAPLLRDYYGFWLHSGQKLKVKGDASVRGDTAGSEEHKDVVVTGLSDDGFLLAEDENRAVMELYPDGNR